MLDDEYDFPQPTGGRGDSFGSGLDDHRRISDTGHVYLLVGKVLYPSLKGGTCYACPLQTLSRCAIRGIWELRPGRPCCCPRRRHLRTAQTEQPSAAAISGSDCPAAARSLMSSRSRKVVVCPRRSREPPLVQPPVRSADRCSWSIRAATGSGYRYDLHLVIRGPCYGACS